MLTARRALTGRVRAAADRLGISMADFVRTRSRQAGEARMLNRNVRIAFAIACALVW
jgi:hypothetical protein